MHWRTSLTVALGSRTAWPPGAADSIDQRTSHGVGVLWSEADQSDRELEVVVPLVISFLL
jgi:hypothetical protein